MVLITHAKISDTVILNRISVIREEKHHPDRVIKAYPFTKVAKTAHGAQPYTSPENRFTAVFSGAKRKQRGDTTPSQENTPANFLGRTNFMMNPTQDQRQHKVRHRHEPLRRLPMPFWA
jgi:hypothetical protein